VEGPHHVAATGTIKAAKSGIAERGNTTVGQAFHRKRISINRSRTRGIGFKYVDIVPPVVRELTTEQIAGRELEAQQQAALDEQRRLQNETINTITTIAGEMLLAWKKVADYHDQRLVDFPGWTTSNYCALPVESGVARFYVDKIAWHKRQADRPLALEELDEIIKASFRRNASTEQIVEEATKAIRYVAQACTNLDGIDLARFIDSMSRRSSRAKHTNTGLDEALAFVGHQMAQHMDKIIP
jgi:hypothetical protein